MIIAKTMPYEKHKALFSLFKSVYQGGVNNEEDKKLLSDIAASFQRFKCAFHQLSFNFTVFLNY